MPQGLRIGGKALAFRFDKTDPFSVAVALRQGGRKHSFRVAFFGYFLGETRK